MKAIQVVKHSEEWSLPNGSDYHFKIEDDQLILGSSIRGGVNPGVVFNSFELPTEVFLAMVENLHDACSANVATRAELSESVGDVQ